MARFVFRLEAVLEQRRAAERAKQLAVGRLEAQRIELENRLRDTQHALQLEREDLREHLAGSGLGTAVDMRTVRLQAGASLMISGRARQAALQLAGVLARLDAARRELIEATTRRRAVETLKERRFQAWRAEQNRLENVANDELAVMSAARGEAVA